MTVDNSCMFYLSQAGSVTSDGQPGCQIWTYGLFVLSVWEQTDKKSRFDKVYDMLSLRRPNDSKSLAHASFSAFVFKKKILDFTIRNVFIELYNIRIIRIYDLYDVLYWWLLCCV